MTIVYPLFFVVFLMGFWIFYKILYKITFLLMFERFSITVAIIFIFFLSPICNILANFFNCTQIYDNFYITNYLLERCNNNPRYDFWANFLIIPSFCFFIVFYPLILFSYMYRNRNILFTENVIYKIGFLLNGYCINTFYW